MSSKTKRLSDRIKKTMEQKSVYWKTTMLGSLVWCLEPIRAVQHGNKCRENEVNSFCEAFVKEQKDALTVEDLVNKVCTDRGVELTDEHKKSLVMVCDNKGYKSPLFCLETEDGLVSPSGWIPDLRDAVIVRPFVEEDGLEE